MIGGGNIILSDLVSTKVPNSFFNSFQGHLTQENPLSSLLLGQSGPCDLTVSWEPALFLPKHTAISTVATILHCPHCDSKTET